MASKGKRSPRSSEGEAGDEGGQPNIDVVLEQLEQVVDQLESGDLPLEQALARFEEGVKLARQGGTMLDAIERRVEVLLAHRGETVPFAGDEGDDGDA